tara:strand:+ start:185 stop:634 length:450 start_codon:yes stop_codon:yes gene_type:complete
MALTKIKLDSMVTGTLPDANIPDDITITGLSGTNSGDNAVNTNYSGLAVTSTSVTDGTNTFNKATDFVSAASGGAFLGGVSIAGNFEPEADGTRNLGASNKRWANVYTADLHLKNDKGDWTVIEGEDELFLRNNLTGKKFAIMMREVDE